jgi:signal transduction histidine kinase
MLPYIWQRIFRSARVVLGLCCLAIELVNSHYALTESGLLFASFTIYAIIALLWRGLEDSGYALLALALDTLFFFVSLSTDAPLMYWLNAVFYAYLLLAAIILHEWWKALFVTTGSIAVVNYLQPVHSDRLLPALLSAGIVGSIIAIEHGLLGDRVASATRQSILHRYDAEKSRESERQRIAADFHDGPLQSFIGFQMRLELIKKLLLRNKGEAMEELEQLQQLARGQVTELRTFVRNMRPVDVDGSLNATLRRVVQQFQKDTGIPASFVSAEFLDPEPEVSLEILQMVREALYNVQKHASATRVGVTIERTENALEILIEDNGHGFPFSGRYSLEELDLLRLGPSSIKRRVRTLGAEMMLDSKPGQGVGLKIRLAS